jgi:hypothetical protein
MLETLRKKASAGNLDVMALRQAIKDIDVGRI